MVEDNPADAGVLRAALSEMASTDFAFRLVHVGKLSEALELLRDGSFDLILLDLCLPDSSGMETVVRIKQAAPILPVIVVTDLDDEHLAIDAMRNGVQDYWVKGQIDRSTLVRAVRYAIERKSADIEVQQRRERQAILHEVNVAVTSTLDLHSVIQILLDEVARLFPDFATTIRFLNPETGFLDPLACRNLDDGAWRATAMRSAGGLANIVAETRKPLAIVDVQNDPRARNVDFFRAHGLISYLGIPLFVEDELIGVIAFYTRHRRHFTEDEVEFFSTLGGQAAMAIHNSRLYERIKAARDALEKALEVKSLLSSVMVHELKTPVQVILGNAELLAEGLCGELSADQKQRVKTIENGAQEILRLIDSSLDMVRVEHGKLPLAITAILVSDLLAELKSQFEERFLKKGIELEIQPPSSDSIMKTDRVKLKEIFTNLLENARKFTHSGKVTIEVAVQDNERVEFIVRDTGVGIKNELLPKIFDLFYQVDISPQERSGVGLGLNIVKRLVDALSGEICVSSEVGKGTAFHLSFPREVTSGSAG